MPASCQDSGASFGHAGVELLGRRLQLSVVVGRVRIEPAERSVVLLAACLLRSSLLCDGRLVLRELLLDGLLALRTRAALLLRAALETGVLLRDCAALARVGQVVLRAVVLVARSHRLRVRRLWRDGPTVGVRLVAARRRAGR